MATRQRGKRKRSTAAVKEEEDETEVLENCFVPGFSCRKREGSICVSWSMKDVRFPLSGLPICPKARLMADNVRGSCQRSESLPTRTAWEHFTPACIAWSAITAFKTLQTNTQRIEQTASKCIAIAAE
eukprot:1819355-Rhodomonas_salina.2